MLREIDLFKKKSVCKVLLKYYTSNLPQTTKELPSINLFLSCLVETMFNRVQAT